MVTSFYIIATDLQERERLTGGVVGTLMSNLGLELALKAREIPFCRAKVGDRYVIAEMLDKGWVLGGENSGHIVCAQHTTTGDAIIAALQVVRRCAGVARPSLRSVWRGTPQVLINVRFSGDRDPIAHPSVKAACDSVTERMGGRGRVLLRKSGTEPLVRVMVEVTTKYRCAAWRKSWPRSLPKFVRERACQGRSR